MPRQHCAVCRRAHRLWRRPQLPQVRQCLGVVAREAYVLDAEGLRVVADGGDDCWVPRIARECLHSAANAKHLTAAAAVLRCCSCCHAPPPAVPRCAAATTRTAESSVTRVKVLMRFQLPCVQLVYSWCTSEQWCVPSGGRGGDAKCCDGGSGGGWSASATSSCSRYVNKACEVQQWQEYQVQALPLLANKQQSASALDAGLEQANERSNTLTADM
jgi:hypothetical protein